jgi:hypothetical protein
MQFQIGTDKYKYIYQAHPTMTCLGKPVYKCCRGVSNTPNGFVLYLCFTDTGHWEAGEAAQDSDEPLRDGKKVFRTRDPVEDITVPGDYHWDYWDTDRVGYVPLNYAFRTKRIMAGFLALEG